LFVVAAAVRAIAKRRRAGVVVVAINPEKLVVCRALSAEEAKKLCSSLGTLTVS